MFYVIQLFEQRKKNAYFAFLSGATTSAVAVISNNNLIQIISKATPNENTKSAMR